MSPCTKKVLIYLILNIVVTSCVNVPERCNQINGHTLADHDCGTINFCTKTFNISYINMPPYAPTDSVQEFLKICCGHCTNFSVVNTFANISEVTPTAIHSSHFVYPFLGSITDKLVNGYFFIPVMHLPNAYYMTMKTEISLFHSIFHLFPLAIICLLMAAVAGFVCWIAEARANTHEFPKAFVKGWFEGFWWSVVSMTTIGYGDKSPKTLIGRLFAIIWIFTGITVCGILTAMLTTTTMDSNNPKAPSMVGARVGVLKHREYDAFLVSHHGGLIVEAEAPTFESSVYELISKLNSKKRHIDGILLDRYTLRSIFVNFSFGLSGSEDAIDDNHKDDIIKFIKDMVLSSVDFSHEVLSYGILVRKEDDYEFLKDIIRSNRFRLHTHLDHQWNREQEKFFHRHRPGLFDLEREYFKTAVISLTGAITAICIFGALYEFVRRGVINCQICSFAKKEERLGIL